MMDASVFRAVVIGLALVMMSASSVLADNQDPGANVTEPQGSQNYTKPPVYITLYTSESARAGVATHVHSVTLTYQEYVAVKEQGNYLIISTSQELEHTHELKIIYDNTGETFRMVRCDDSWRCWDRHNSYLYELDTQTTETASTETSLTSVSPSTTSASPEDSHPTVNVTEEPMSQNYTETPVHITLYTSESDLAGVATHVHSVTLTYQEYVAVKEQGNYLMISTSQEVNHSHDLKITYDNTGKAFRITLCDNLWQCWDRHNSYLYESDPSEN